MDAPSPEESKILALEAKVSSLEKKSKGNQGGGANKGKKAKEAAEGKNQTPDWMVKAPPPDEMELPKTVNAKKYYWCKPLASYCRHHPKDFNVTKSTTSVTSASSSISSKDDTKGKLRFSNALANVAEAGEDDDDSEAS